MRSSPVRFGILLLVGAAILAASASGTSYVGSITSSDPSHLNYVDQTSTGSSCAAPKSYPGTVSDPLNYHYDTYSEAVASQMCMTIQLSIPSNVSGAGATAFAYLNSFNPSDLSQNYLGDIGGEVLPNQTRSFSVLVPAGQTLVAEVEEWAAGEGVSSYTLTISGAATAVKLLSASAVRTARGVAVRWRTASAVDVLGFDVYRLVNGKAVRVNRGLIPAGAGALHGSRYSVLDRGASKVGLLRYRIDAVDVHGAHSVVARLYAQTR